MSHNDYQMALLLQQQFEQEVNVENPTNNLVYVNNKNKSKHNRNDSRSLTDPSWELIDPTPDIHLLFIAFNEKYFWNKLQAVCVAWSKRMTTCAGMCCYQGIGGLCRITLSEPLLKLRPRKDLLETLLHEMIHAFLFVTRNNKDRDGHGPEFHKHMYRINAEAGTNITVYHNFHDEVRLYQQHWWRCNGPCQNIKPFFGMVRRATNRAPGPNDFWWNQHQHTCGGTFIKVKEPEKSAKNKENKATNPNNDIRKFIPVLKEKNPILTPTINATGFPNNIPGPSNNKIMGFKDLNMVIPKNTLSNSSSTIVINKKPSTTVKQPNTAKSPLVQTTLTSVSTFTGNGQTLGSTQAKPSSPDYAAVRNHWANKFPNVQNTKRSSSSESSDLEFSPKRHKTHFDNEIISSHQVTCPVCNKMLLEADMNSHLDQCLTEQASKDVTSKCPICDKEVETSKIEEHVQVCVNEVFDNSDDVMFVDSKPDELISCLVCNKKITKSELNSHLDDCMSDNIFNNSNADRDIKEEENEDFKNEDEKKKYNCPVCFEEYTISEMSNHLDQCMLNDSVTSESDGVLNSFLEDPF